MTVLAHAVDPSFTVGIEEEYLLRETEYFERWRFDYRLYRPIFRFARQQELWLVKRPGCPYLSEQIRWPPEARPH